MIVLNVLPDLDPGLAELGYVRPEVPIHIRWCPWDDAFVDCCPQESPCAKHRDDPQPGVSRMVEAGSLPPFLPPVMVYTLDERARAALTSCRTGHTYVDDVCVRCEARPSWTRAATPQVNATDASS